MSAIKDYYTIRLHDTDSAGILFFANQFRIVHDVYENFLTQIGYGIRERFEKRDFLIPIVHAKADFLQPLKIGETIEIELSVAEIGQTSFTLHFRLTDSGGAAVGSVETVHATVDPKGMKKIDLPDGFREKLEETNQGS